MYVDLYLNKRVSEPHLVVEGTSSKRGDVRSLRPSGKSKQSMTLVEWSGYVFSLESVRVLLRKYLRRNDAEWDAVC